MVKRVAAILVAVALILGSCGPSLNAATTTGTYNQLKILTIGDSITQPGLWQAEMCRLVEGYTSVDCDIRNEAVPGTGCTYWSSRIGALLVEHQPDMVVFACGTNDYTVPLANQEFLGMHFRITVEAIRTFRNPPIEIVPTLIQYSDPLVAAPWVIESEPKTNDALYTNMLYYIPAGWFTGIIDWQSVPSSSEYLDAGGIHPTQRGYRYLGRLAYDRIAPGMGWPQNPEPVLCGLTGHRRPYPRPPSPSCLGV